jgi:predicted dehydrogenase
MLAAGAPDAVTISSVTREHCPQLLRLLAADGPRAILVEKPVCETPAELEALLARHAGRPDVLVLANHTRRFDPGHVRLAAEIRSGKLGRLLGGRCDYYGGWLHNGSHLVDTLRMLVGELRIDRAAVGVPGRPGDPCLDVRVLAGEAPIDLSGFDERHYQLFESDLRFAEGRVLARNFGAELAIEGVTNNTIDERFLRMLPGSPWQGLDDSLLHAVDAMAEHLAGVVPASASGATLEDAAQTMRTLWLAAALV